eukprot:scaffold4488_cov185-Alexandrium_tamarense.AAC.5
MLVLLWGGRGLVGAALDGRRTDGYRSTDKKLNPTSLCPRPSPLPGKVGKAVLSHTMNLNRDSRVSESERRMGG